MQASARRFVCKATFTRCIRVCLQYSAILTEVRTKLGLKAYRTFKSPLWLEEYKVTREVSTLESVVKKQRKLGKYMLA